MQGNIIMADKKVEDVEEVTETMSEKVDNIAEKCIKFFSPITEKVRELVLGFGEIIVTVSVLIGVITAVIGGISDMINIGFFTGLSNMFSNIVSVIMGALVIFLLFAIYRNGQKGKK
jgi:phosphoglycerol transferase MdoB-like AlkP superfamily enzyme